MNSVIDEYLAGTAKLREATAGLSHEQQRTRPVAGKWSILEVVAHLADFEPVYADRMKRVIAEETPALMSGDPDLFAAKLAYHARDLDEELRLIDAVRGQMARILRQVDPAAWSRAGKHSTDGLISLQTLLTRITNHIPHHLPFIVEKRKAMGV
ncbi:MAG: DinB family protein [Planctomycetota bacterium]|nr:DinB family protein [Planctomycetota bacterium]